MNEKDSDFILEFIPIPGQVTEPIDTGSLTARTDVIVMQPKNDTHREASKKSIFRKS